MVTALDDAVDDDIVFGRLSFAERTDCLYRAGQEGRALPNRPSVFVSQDWQSVSPSSIPRRQQGGALPACGLSILSVLQANRNVCTEHILLAEYVYHLLRWARDKKFLDDLESSKHLDVRPLHVLPD